MEVENLGLSTLSEGTLEWRCKGFRRSQHICFVGCFFVLRFKGHYESTGLGLAGSL
jgi:hypothetical protein